MTNDLTTEQKREYLRLILEDGPEAAYAYMESITEPVFFIGPQLRPGSGCDCQYTFKSLEDALLFISENEIRWPTVVCIEEWEPDKN